jgi:glycerophosphoryl diester phosphodiesterase
LPEYYGIYTPHPEAYVKTVLDLINASGMLSRTTLQSFDLNILEETHKTYPNVAIALLVDDSKSIKEELAALSFKPEIISPYFRLLDGEQVAFYQKKGFQIIPWTVNTNEDLELVLSWKVDGIITDYPNRLLSLLKD